MKTMKSYRLSSNTIDILDSLKAKNPGLTETEIIEHALDIVQMIDDAWANTHRLIGFGSFKIDKPAHKRELERTIWGID